MFGDLTEKCIRCGVFRFAAELIAANKGFLKLKHCSKNPKPLEFLKTNGDPYGENEAELKGWIGDQDSEAIHAMEWKKPFDRQNRTAIFANAARGSLIGTGPAV